jgi:hypothetical protein
VPRSVALNAAARAWRVALIWPVRPGRRGQGEAQEGFAQLEVAVPSLPFGQVCRGQEEADEPGHHRDGPA